MHLQTNSFINRILFFFDTNGIKYLFVHVTYIENCSILVYKELFILYGRSCVDIHMISYLFVSHLWLMPVFVIDLGICKWVWLQYWLLFEAAEVINLDKHLSLRNLKWKIIVWLMCHIERHWYCHVFLEGKTSQDSFVLPTLFTEEARVLWSF